MKAIITNVTRDGAGLRFFWRIDPIGIEKSEIFPSEVSRIDIRAKIKASKVEYEEAEDRVANLQDMIGLEID